MKASNEVKMLANVAVEEIKRYKRVFKYLTYESGLKMLSYNNIQFTRADMLNDEVDCHISKVNFDYVIDAAMAMGINADELLDKVVTKHRKPISSFGICSLGMTANNNVLWNRYTKTNDVADGICIELDLNAVINFFIKKHIKVVALKVDYVDKTVESIPYELYIGAKVNQFRFFKLLFATKQVNPWGDEKEIRMVLPYELADEYQRYELFKSCFKGIYLGQDVTDKQRGEVQRIIENAKLKLKIQTIDPKTPITQQYENE